MRIIPIDRWIVMRAAGAVAFPDETTLSSKTKVYNSLLLHQPLGYVLHVGFAEG
jgi:hypothetical protein